MTMPLQGSLPDGIPTRDGIFASLPWYLPPGQTFHPVIDLATAAPPGDEIHVSFRTYLGSSCKVTGWF